MDDFKVPQAIPQDLLLIQEIVGVQDLPAPDKTPEVPAPKVTEPVKEDEDIGSSGEENESENEIAADLVAGGATDDDELTKVAQKPLSEPSESSDSDSNSDSDSDSSDTDDNDGVRDTKFVNDLDDDEDPLPAAGPNTYFTTKHEIVEADIPVPDIDEVGSDEVLEKVGEVMNIVDRLVIVRGLPADSTTGRSSDQALDSDTLLVFDDRKVVGYIYETFGPTSQPFYQIKFNSAFPLDLERVRLGREVFHVPARSRFVFLSQIKAFKGSDASNVHDEEPADDELEFSDDEAEAAYKSRLKRKRGERARSVASSRQSTPNPTLMRDQELADAAILGRNAYDEHGPYDIDYTAPGPSSRPAPIPYDDPYGDDYTASDVADRETAFLSQTKSGNNGAGSFSGSGPSSGRRGGERGHGRYGGPGRDQDRGRGRGRGRDRGGPRDRGRGRGGGNGGGRGPQQQYGQDSATSRDAGGESTRSLSPTSLAIARATGQSGGYAASQQQQGFPQHGYNQQNSYPGPQMFGQDYQQNAPWNYAHMAAQYLPMNQQPQQFMQFGQQQNQGYKYQGHQPDFNFAAMSGGQGIPPFVQPHINPRFASNFGLGVGIMPQMQQAYAPGGMSNVMPDPGPQSSMGANMGWSLGSQGNEAASSAQSHPTSGTSSSEMDAQK